MDKGTLVFQIPVSPSYTVYYEKATKAIKVFDLDADQIDAQLEYIPTYKYIADQFQYWRGNMVYKFTAFKTNYQTCRLSIVWVPNDSDPTNYVETQNLGNIMWDTSVNSEIEVEVPFMQNKAFCRTLACASTIKEGTQSGKTYMMYNPMTTSQGQDLLGQNMARDRYCNGTLMVYVTNPLISSGAAAKIDIVVTARFEKPQLQVPANRVPFFPVRVINSDLGGTLYSPYRTLKKEKKKEKDKDTVNETPSVRVARSAEDNTYGIIEKEKEGGGSRVYDPETGLEIDVLRAQGGDSRPLNLTRSTPLHGGEVDINYEEYTVGETILSARQMITRFSRYFRAQGAKNVDAIVKYEIYPWQIWNPSMSWYDNKTFNTVPSTYDFIASMFMWASGSMRYKMLVPPHSTASLEYPISFSADPGVTGWVDIPLAVRSDDDNICRQLEFLGNNNAGTHYSVDGVLEVQVPYYGRCSKRRVYCGAGYYDDVDPKWDVQDTSPNIGVYMPVTNSSGTIQKNYYKNR